MCLWFVIAMDAEKESRASQQTMQIGADDDVRWCLNIADVNFFKRGLADTR